MALRFIERWFLLAVTAASVASASSAPLLRAGGSTLITPVMRKWASEYGAATGASVDYASVGSGQGIAGMTEKSLDFGCTDAPMSTAELEQADKRGGTVVHIPLTMGAVAPIYNVPGITARLRFSGPVLAAIFLGRIQRWDDPALRALNPDTPLPNEAIGVVHRMDSSGTTYVWTDFLSKTSPEWLETVGTGKIVAWPTGTSANGNEGVAGQVKLFPYSIGYAQLTYGIQEALAYGAVENRAGEFIEPQPAAVTAAADASLTIIPDDLRFSITDAPGNASYPVSATTWAVVYVNQPDGKGPAIADFLRWVVHDAQQFSEPLHYAPLPAALVERAERKINEIAASQ
jgi:phosphate transport system substrate-binding protein